MDLYADTEAGLEKAKEVFKRFKEGEKIQNEELQMKKKTGEFIWINLSINPVFDKTGNIIESRSMVVDIIENKEIEQKLKESEKNYRIAFDRANFYKDLVIHDINNILNIIVSDVQLYSLYQKNPDKSKDPNTLIKRIGEAGYRGVRLVSNIQKLSKLEEVEKSKEIVDVFKVLNGAVNFIKKTYREKEVNIKLELYSKKAKVIADELILDVFENILTNAVKYNENSPIEILVRISKFQKERIKFVKIEFIDNGIGISDSRKENIFQRAYKEDISVSGMGFGLTLVKKIIENYKGEIWVENRVKDDYTMGSNFIILIPEGI